MGGMLVYFVCFIKHCILLLLQIRNSATLLFSALVTRIFGVQRTRDSDSLSTKNKMTVKVFFMRYPELHQFLLKELINGCENSSSLTIFPILLILSRLYPSNLDDTGVNVCLLDFFV